MTEIEKAFLAGYLQAKGVPATVTNQTKRLYLRIVFRTSPPMGKRLTDTFGGKRTGRKNLWWTINGKAAERMFLLLLPFFSPGRQKRIRIILDGIEQHNSQFPAKKPGRPRRK